MDENGYPVPEMLNNAAALRQFQRPGFVSGTRWFVRAAIRHRVTGAIIAIIVVSGAVGAIATFWPG
jgi:hypothetical protein